MKKAGGTVGALKKGVWVTTDQLRRQLNAIAFMTHAKDIPVDSGTREGKPVYRLDSAKTLPKEVVDRSIPVTVDEVRTTFSEVRALLRVEANLSFAIKVDGEIAAVLRRHPDYVPKGVAKYRDIARSRGATAAIPDVQSQLSKILRVIEDRFDHLESRLSSLENKLGQRGKRYNRNST